MPPLIAPAVRQFFLNTTVRNYEKFVLGLHNGVLSIDDDLARLGAAADGCLHLADYVFEDLWQQLNYTYDRRDRGRFVSDRATGYANFQTARDIADAIKHRIVERKSSTIAGIESLFELLTVTRYEDSDGYYYVAAKAISVNLKDGSVCLAEDRLFNAIMEWRVWLVKMDVLENENFNIRTSARMLARAEVPRRPALTIEEVVGEGCKYLMERMVFDESTDTLRALEDGEEFYTTIDVTFRRLPSRSAEQGQIELVEQVMIVRDKDELLMPPGGTRFADLKDA